LNWNAMNFLLKNIGTTDRYLRVTLGLLIGIVGYAYQSWSGLLGLVLIATAFLGSCPIYTLLGIHTCKVKPRTPRTVKS